MWSVFRNYAPVTIFVNSLSCAFLTPPLLYVSERVYKIGRPASTLVDVISGRALSPREILSAGSILTEANGERKGEKTSDISSPFRTGRDALSHSTSFVSCCKICPAC